MFVDRDRSRRTIPAYVCTRLLPTETKLSCRQLWLISACAELGNKPRWLREIRPTGETISFDLGKAQRSERAPADLVDNYCSGVHGLTGAPHLSRCVTIILDFLRWFMAKVVF